MAELTSADLANYHVTLNTAEGSQTFTIRAAYSTSEPGWLLLKDHEHRIVAQFHHNHVIMVQRGDSAAAPQSDEEKIRDAMAEAQQNPGRIVTVS